MTPRPFILAVLLLAALPARAEEPDALVLFERTLLGATLTNACDPAFDWTRTEQGADAIGQRAFDALLAMVREVDATATDAEAKADRAFALRSGYVVRKGQAMVAAQGCQAPAIQQLLRDFAGRPW